MFRASLCPSSSGAYKLQQQPLVYRRNVVVAVLLVVVGPAGRPARPRPTSLLSCEPYVTVYLSAWRNFPEDLDCQRHRYDTFDYLHIPSFSFFSVAFRTMSVLCAFCPLHHTGIIYLSLSSVRIGHIFCSAAFLFGKRVAHSCLPAVYFSAGLVGRTRPSRNVQYLRPLVV